MFPRYHSNCIQISDATFRLYQALYFNAVIRKPLLDKLSQLQLGSDKSFEIHAIGSQHPPTLFKPVFQTVFVTAFILFIFNIISSFSYIVKSKFVLHFVYMQLLLLYNSYNMQEAYKNTLSTLAKLLQKICESFIIIFLY